MDNYLALLEWCLKHIWLIVGVLVGACVIWGVVCYIIGNYQERRRHVGTYRLVNGKFVYERSKWWH